MRMVRLSPDAADAVHAALAARLEVDPGNVSGEGFTAEYAGGTSPVVVRWSGVATMTVDEFDALVAAAVASTPAE